MKINEEIYQSTERYTENPSSLLERRVATILMADVFNGVELMEQFGSEIWAEIMNQALNIFQDEIIRFGGRIDQFRGESLVAFFGVDAAHEDDPERAVQAALEIQKKFKISPIKVDENRSLPLQVRIGINTGEIITTGLGKQSPQSDNTAMGEAISIAARMQTAAQPGTVLVSEKTYHTVAHRFAWQSLGKISVKGMNDPIAVFCPANL